MKLERKMAEGNKQNPIEKAKQPISDLLMKAFRLGWTREVVKRVVTHSGAPNCDIYYFSPDKKKFRSLTEVKNNLSHGLGADCFSFRREVLGLGPQYETVRNAQVRRKVGRQSTLKRKAAHATEKPAGSSTEPEKGTKIERRTIRRREDGSLKKSTRRSRSSIGDRTVAAGRGRRQETKSEPKRDTFAISRRAKSDRNKSKEYSDFVTGKLRAKPVNPAKPEKPANPRLQAARSRKATLRLKMSMKQAKQSKVVPTRLGVKAVARKNVTSPKVELARRLREKKADLKVKKTISAKVTSASKPRRTSLAKKDMSRPVEGDRKVRARDLKTIVQKNIGKYRRMRERQKLAISQPKRSSNNKAAAPRRLRSEPIAKNRKFYLKPLEKGWRRELVYRTNCAKSGQQADVYYFHPSGKKLRSCREIVENLTHGLSIEHFTFRKEPLGCGEPSEVIRMARSLQRH